MTSSFPAIGNESFAFATSQPNATFINNAFSANAAGMQGTNYLGGEAAPRTRSSTVNFVIDSQTLSGDLILGLLDLNANGIGFNDVNLTVKVEGVTKVDVNFLTSGVATPFFDDTVVNLGVVDTLPDLDVSISFTWQAQVSGIGLGILYLLGTTNDAIDIIPPAKPGTPDLSDFADRGASSTDALTNLNLPTFTDKTEANAKVSLGSGTTEIGSGTADKAGLWTITATKVLADGVHLINVKATDAAGNSSVPYHDLTVTIDTVVPVSPTPDLDAASDSGASATDNVTNDATPSFVGVTEAGAKVSVTVGNVTIGDATADNDGKWSLTAPNQIADGTHNVTTIVTDRAGNIGKASGPLSITIDTVAPVVPGTPDMVAASDTGASDTHNITRQQFPTLVGTAEADAEITLFDGVTKVGAAKAAGDGTWSIKSDQLAHGTHVLTVTATDLAGNVSAASAALTVEVDRIAPATQTAPVLHATSDSGRSDAYDIANDATPLLTGRTQVNTVVAVFDGGTKLGLAKVAANAIVTILEGAKALGTTTADMSGKWSFSTGTLADGNHVLTARATDPAGNVSAPSTGLTIDIDTKIAPSTQPFGDGGGYRCLRHRQRHADNHPDLCRDGRSAVHDRGVRQHDPARNGQGERDRQLVVQVTGPGGWRACDPHAGHRWRGQCQRLLRRGERHHRRRCSGGARRARSAGILR